MNLLRRGLISGPSIVTQNLRLFSVSWSVVIASITTPFTSSTSADGHRFHPDAAAKIAREIHRYMSKVSGPLLDRIDIHKLMRLNAR